MKFKIMNTEVSRKLKLIILILGTLFTLQGCMFGLGGDDSEESTEICEGISEGIDPNVSRADCTDSGREYILERGCYCGAS